MGLFCRPLFAFQSPSFVLLTFSDHLTLHFHIVLESTTRFVGLVMLSHHLLHGALLLLDSFPLFFLVFLEFLFLLVWHGTRCGFPLRQEEEYGRDNTKYECSHWV